MLIRDDDLLMLATVDGVPLIPLLKKAHLVNSNSSQIHSPVKMPAENLKNVDTISDSLRVLTL